MNEPKPGQIERRGWTRGLPGERRGRLCDRREHRDQWRSAHAVAVGAAGPDERAEPWSGAYLTGMRSPAKAALRDPELTRTSLGAVDPCGPPRRNRARHQMYATP